MQKNPKIAAMIQATTTAENAIKALQRLIGFGLDDEMMIQAVRTAFEREHRHLVAELRQAIISWNAANEALCAECNATGDVDLIDFVKRQRFLTAQTRTDFERDLAEITKLTADFLPALPDPKEPKCEDHLLLKRVIEGEYCPRYLCLTGGTFAAMLAAVKALPFRKFEEQDMEIAARYPRKHWLIRGDGLKLLREQGFTVSQEPDIRIDTRSLDIKDHRFFNQKTLSWEDDPGVTAVIGMRDRLGQWETVFTRDVPVPHDDVTIAAACAEIDRRPAVVNLTLGPAQFPPASRSTAIRHLGLRVLKALEEQVRQRFEASTEGKRTLEAFLHGAEAVKAFIEEDLPPPEPPTTTRPEG